MDGQRDVEMAVPKLVDHQRTEEATKNALLLPFIAALGYDVFDPRWPPKCVEPHRNPKWPEVCETLLAGNSISRSKSYKQGGDIIMTTGQDKSDGGAVPKGVSEVSDSNLHRRILEKREDAAVVATALASRMREVGLRAVLAIEDNSLQITNTDGDRVALKADVSAPFAPQPTVQYEAQACGETFCWKVTMSRDDALTFRKFMKVGSRLHRAEMRKLVAALGGSPTADEEDDDKAFCAITGALLSFASGPGGALVAATCLWFASNGLDEDDSGDTGGED